MATLKIHEQIASLRKQKGMTQEELANALGVTNQAVSKWESAQCCPDIQLLPAIAKLFGVSVDELLSDAPASVPGGMVLALRKKVEALPREEAAVFAVQAAAALHTALLRKGAEGRPGPVPEGNADNAAEWGYSCLSMPEITTTRRRDVIFFSGNRGLDLSQRDIVQIVSLIKPFSDGKNLKAAEALYRATVHSESAYASAEELSELTGMPAEQLRDCLEGELAPFLEEEDGAGGRFRLRGMYQNLLPILSLLDFQ